MVSLAVTVNLSAIKLIAVGLEVTGKNNDILIYSIITLTVVCHKHSSKGKWGAAEVY
jgi:hypothetical protein